MGEIYKAVAWNRQKQRYDTILAVAVAISILVFGALSVLAGRNLTIETLIIRSTSVVALVLLHLILCIGPLARLDSRFLPLLYNRRHLGVTMFVLAAVHAVFAAIQFHVLGDVNPLVSVFTAYGSDTSAWAWGGRLAAHAPFEPFGAFALVVLLVMASTSHDFWLKTLGASFWKTLHMFVYAAYGAVIVHVALGALQSERAPLYSLVLGAGFLTVAGLHLAAFYSEARRDRQLHRSEGGVDDEDYVAVCDLSEIQEGRGKVVTVDGERLALFQRQGRLFALSNVCRHQGGPLGEGRIIDDCVTCPWHGYQYRAHDGASPPPFSEVVPTYPVRVRDGRVWVSPHPHPLRTASAGADASAAPAGELAATAAQDEFYVGYLAQAPQGIAGYLTRLVPVVCVAAFVLVGVLAGTQNRGPEGVFEFGVARPFEGILEVEPVPILRVGDSDAEQAFLLVSLGKFGLPEYARVHAGERVRFSGSLIYQGPLAMIEMNDPESFEVVDAEVPVSPRAAVRSLGRVSIEGEIVDTKCFFGVMKPATGKVHRACAIRCLSGGIPPGLLVRHGDDRETVFVLAGPEGRGLDFDIEWAGTAVRVAGELQVHDGIPVLRADTIERVGA